MGLRVRRSGHASWTSDVATGVGRITLQSGALDAPYSLRSREGDTGDAHTNPEELIGAALAGCFAMSLANLLSESGHAPTVVKARATVQLEHVTAGFSITKIDLEAGGEVEGVSDAAFIALAQKAKDTCPVSKALAGTTITLNAGLNVLAASMADRA